MDRCRERHPAGGHGRRGALTVDGLVVEEDVGPECGQELGLGNAAEEERLQLVVDRARVDHSSQQLASFLADRIAVGVEVGLGKDDPPLFMSYGNNMKLPSENAGHGIHHPVYGVKMKEKADAEKLYGIQNA